MAAIRTKFYQYESVFVNVKNHIKFDHTACRMAIVLRWWLGESIGPVALASLSKSRLREMGLLEWNVSAVVMTLVRNRPPRSRPPKNYLVAISYRFHLVMPYMTKSRCH